MTRSGSERVESMNDRRSQKIVATVEARMTSSRLPGKVLLEAAGRPMLGHLVDRLRAVPAIEAICIATTVNATDDRIEKFATEAGVACFRGSEEDVLARVLGAARSVAGEILVEITGDCPVIDPAVVSRVIQAYLESDCEYASNVGARTWPDGMDTQVFGVDLLARVEARTSDPLDREHVSLFIRSRSDEFSAVNVPAPAACDWPELGLTLDERADYELLRRVIEHFHPEEPCFTCEQVVALLRERPDWVAMNEAVVRKGDH